MKKLLAATLAVAFIFGAVGASAQSMAVSAVVGGAYTQVFDEPAAFTQFPIAIWMDPAGQPSSAAEFTVTEIGQFGFIKASTAKINNTNLDLGDNSTGEYILSFATCWPAEPVVELVRVTYVGFSPNLIPADFVVSLTGTIPSTFSGEPGFVNCSQTGFAAPMGGADGGSTGAGVEFPDGSLVIDATPLAVDTDASSLSQLKARF